MDMTQQIVLNSLSAGSSYALIALGFGLIYSTARFFHFSHGAVYTVGAYSTYALTVLVGFPWWLGLLGGVVVASVMGGLIERTIYRPMRHKGATPLTLLLSSIGILVVLQNVIALVFGNETYMIGRRIVTQGILVFGGRLTTVQIANIAISLLLVTCAWVLLEATRIGSVLRAVAIDPELSRVYGIRTSHSVFLCFVAGSAIAGLAGVLEGYETGVTPLMGFRALLMGIVAAIVGGVGSVPGSLLGGLLIGLAQNISVVWLPSQWQDAIVYFILVAFLLMRPQGFLGRPLGKASV
jgi:branched-chain amino acid transport system permease protein